MMGLIEAGMDVARINSSHGTLEQHLHTYHRLRAISADAGREIGILVDLPGPKVRCASFGEEGAELTEGDVITVLTGDRSSTGERVEVQYETLAIDLGYSSLERLEKTRQLEPLRSRPACQEQVDRLR